MVFFKLPDLSDFSKNLMEDVTECPWKMPKTFRKFTKNCMGGWDYFQREMRPHGNHLRHSWLCSLKRQCEQAKGLEFFNINEKFCDTNFDLHGEIHG